jgi:hypothetical protein
MDREWLPVCVEQQGRVLADIYHVVRYLMTYLS